MSPVAKLLSSDGTRFVIRRTISLVLVLAILVCISFLLVHLIPGDPARRIGGIDATPEQVESIREQLGLTNTLLTQFGNYIQGLANFNWGNSFVTGEPVTDVLARRFSATAKLASAAIALTLVVSVLGGLVMAALTRDARRPKLEAIFTAVTGGAAALPGFLAGTFLAFLFAVELGWLPVAGAENGIRSMILPVLAISLAPTAILIRIVRLEALDVLGQDFIRVAGSRNVQGLRLYGRHVVPNVLASALTIGGLTFGTLLGSAVVVENVFAWPGMGPTLVQAVSKHDYPLVQGSILVLGASVIVINAVVDACLALLDRRSLVSTT